MSESVGGQPSHGTTVQGGPVPPGSLLPFVPVSQFHMAINVNELVLVLGHLQPLIDAATGQPSKAPGLAWVVAASISPAAAKLLHQALGEALQQYEKTFGPIPADPNANLVITPATSATSP